MAKDQGEPSLPPPDLHERKIKLTSSKDFVQSEWFRIAKTRHGALHFSQDSGWRFSRADMPGTLYIAESNATAFKEVFWDDLVSRTPKDRAIDRAKIEERSWYTGILNHEFSVIDTTDGETLDDMSCHGGTFGGAYAVCQKWAFELRKLKSKPAGILYESVRNKGEVCLALFREHFPDAYLSFTPANSLIDTPLLEGKSSVANVVITEVLTNGRWNYRNDPGH